MTIQKNKFFLQVASLIPKVSTLNDEKLEWVKLKILKNNYIKENFFSEDFKKTILKINPVSTNQQSSYYKTYSEINKIIEHYRWRYPNLIFTEIGDPVLSFWSGKTIIADFKVIISFFIALVFLFIALILQQIPVLIFYLVSTLSSMAWTFGIMSLFNVEFTFLTALLIPFTMVLNIIFTVYFYESFLRNKNVFNFISRSPITALLTVIFSILAGSFFAKSNAIFNFMFFLFLITLISLTINIVILPAYIRMTGFTSKISLDKSNFVNELIYYYKNKQTFIFFMLIALIVIFAPGLRDLQISTEGYSSLDKSSFVRSSYDTFNSEFYGAESMTINAFAKDLPLDNSEITLLMNTLKEKLTGNYDIGLVASLIDLDYLNIDLYPIKIKQNYLDSKGNPRAIISVKNSQLGFFKRIKKYTNNLLKNKYPALFNKINLSFSGELSLKYKIVVNTFKNLYLVFFISFFLVFSLLFYFYGSLLNTLKSFIPSISSLFIVYGYMGYMNVNIDFASIIAGFFTLNIGIFLSICLKNILDYFKISICIFICISFPFLTLLFADYFPFVKFGLIMFFTMFITSIISLLILPTLDFKKSN